MRGRSSPAARKASLRYAHHRVRRRQRPGLVEQIIERELAPARQRILRSRDHRPRLVEQNLSCQIILFLTARDTTDDQIEPAFAQLTQHLRK